MYALICRYIFHFNAMYQDCFLYTQLQIFFLGSSSFPLISRYTCTYDYYEHLVISNISYTLLVNALSLKSYPVNFLI